MISKEFEEIMVLLPKIDNNYLKFSTENHLERKLINLVDTCNDKCIVTTLLKKNNWVISSNKNTFILFHGKNFSLEINVIDQADRENVTISPGCNQTYVSLSGEFDYETRNIEGEFLKNNLKTFNHQKISNIAVKIESNKQTFTFLNKKTILLFKITTLKNSNPALVFSRDSENFLYSIDERTHTSRMNNALKFISKIGSDFRILEGITNRIRSKNVGVRWNAFLAYINVKNGINVDKEIILELSNDESIVIRQLMKKLLEM